jgi:colicin import membrane protein
VTVRYAYWQDRGGGNRIFRAVVISLVFHLTLVTGLYFVATYKSSFVMPATLQIRYIPYPKGEPQKKSGEDKQAKTPPKAAEPKPEPPPEPKPAPPKPEPPKPEPKPEPPKPEPPKPEPPKPEPKSEPKPKPEAKPDAKAAKDTRPKTEPKSGLGPSPRSAVEAKPGLKAGDREGSPKDWMEDAPMKTGITMPEGLPTVLDSWARAVQKKVEKFWQTPSGIDLKGDNQALVSFWVDRQGNLVKKPEVVKAAGDAILGESGVRAIELAAPLPPLPVDFKEQQQEVIYTFTLAQ